LLHFKPKPSTKQNPPSSTKDGAQQNTQSNGVTKENGTDTNAIVIRMISFEENKPQLVLVVNESRLFNVSWKIALNKGPTKNPENNNTSVSSESTVQVNIHEYLLPNKKAPQGQKDPTVVNCKFSFDDKYLALLYTPSQIEFIHLHDPNQSFIHSATAGYSLVGKKASPIINFWWTSVENFFIVTSTAVELYQFKLKLKLLKDIKLNTISWVVFEPKHRVLLVASPPTTANGITSVVIQPISFAPNNMAKLQRLTLTTQGKVSMKETDVLLANLYGKFYVIHNDSQNSAEIVLYQLSRETVIKAFTLNLHSPSPVQLQIIDHLIVVHNMYAKIIMIFDIKEADLSFPIAAPLPLGVNLMKKILSTNKSSAVGTFESNQLQQLYTPQWSIKFPNLIFDAHETFFNVYEVGVNLQAIAASFADRKKLVDFLVKRSHPETKKILLTTIKNLIEDCESLQVISEVFDLCNEILGLFVNKPQTVVKPPPSENELEFWTDEVATSPSKEFYMLDGHNYIIISQEDIFTHVLLPIEEEKQQGLDHKYMVSVLTEYIRSLNYNHITVEPFLYELLINYLVSNKRYYQLHQLLQYHVLTDSVHVACQLLSIESTYPPAYQLALDMLKRIHTNAEILEVLLTKKQILAALKFVRQHKNLKVVPARFLDLAISEESTLFYTVYKFFEQRKELTPECAPYTAKFKEMFLTKPPPDPKREYNWKW